MTAAHVVIGGQRRIIGLKPSDTAQHTMLTAGADMPVVVGLIVANNTASGIAATVRWGDGTTDYDIIAAKSVAANDVYMPDMPPIPLRSGYTIKVTSGTGSALTFSLILAATGSATHGSDASRG